eukprot:643112-Rhodomonas_salina.1
MYVIGERGAREREGGEGEGVLDSRRGTWVPDISKTVVVGHLYDLGGHPVGRAYYCIAPGTESMVNVCTVHRAFVLCTGHLYRALRSTYMGQMHSEIIRPETTFLVQFVRSWGGSCS